MAKRVTIRNVHVILGAAVFLVVLVAIALTWLGWRLLSQEEVLAQQQMRNRLEQNAELLLTGFLRHMTETEVWLNQAGATAAAIDAASQPAGSILVTFSQSGIETRPANQLLYHPIAPTARAIDNEIFADAERIEFQSADLKAARLAFISLTGHKDPMIRAEALLRLARVQSKSGEIAEAIATYEKLADEKSISPLGASYSLLSRFRRCQLLANSPQETRARQEAQALVAGLESGQWPLGKEDYVYYLSEARKLSGASSESAELKGRLAVAEIVESAWTEWQIFQHSTSRALTKHLHKSGDAPVLAVLNANPERLVALIYAGESLRHLGLDPSEEGGDTALRTAVTDERGRFIFGTTPEATDIQATRPLSAAELPWQFTVVTSKAAAAAGFVPERRQFFVFALVAIILLVALASYAMARGVLREAAANRLQSDFVSAVSHEFRSPLTTLRQLTELLSEGRINDESRRRLYFNVLQKETTRLYQLVEDLLDFGRMDAGRRQYRIESFDFSQLVREGITEYQGESSANGHRVELTSVDRELVVDGDREALRRVVRNLVENAVKYSPDADTVWVETGCEKRAAVLRVRDQGIGIPPEERSRIFEKFVRGQAAKEACIPGTGIGLAMVQEIVRVHHGELDVDSEVGRGSTFVVRLPLRI